MELMPGFDSARAIFCTIAWAATLLAALMFIISFFTDFDGGDADGIGTGNGLLIIEELTLQLAGDEQGGAHLEEDVALTLGDLGHFLAVRTDAFHFLEG